MSNQQLFRDIKDPNDNLLLTFVREHVLVGTDKWGVGFFTHFDREGWHFKNSENEVFTCKEYRGLVSINVEIK